MDGGEPGVARRDTVASVNLKVVVRFHRRAHLPIVPASRLLDTAVKVP